MNGTPGVIPCASSHHNDIIMGGARGQSPLIFLMDPPHFFKVTTCRNLCSIYSLSYVSDNDVS